MQLQQLIVEPDREDHIARHGVTLDEVDEVIANSPLMRRTEGERYRLTGQTDAGRYLTIIVARRRAGIFRLVTARRATDVERRAHQARRR